MSESTAIEWTDSTFNPWEGCQKVGPGCDHCYAETRNARFGGGTAINWGPGAPRRRTSVKNWNLPRRWNSSQFYECRCCGWRGDEHDKEFRTPRGGCIHDLMPARRRVFCSSLADVFDNAVDPEWRRDLFELIRATPNLDWLLLTKRIGNVQSMVMAANVHGMVAGNGFNSGLPGNVWIGATIVNQEEANRDIPKLLKVPAAKRFLSMEPLLGPVDLTRIDIAGDFEIYPLKGTTECEDYDGPIADIPALDWVIVGGESGPGARPMHPDWARSLRDQCEKAGVPFLFKQWGEWGPIGTFEPFPGDALMATAKILIDTDRNGFQRHGPTMLRRGKKANGRMLDGRTHDGFPITTESIA